MPRAADAVRMYWPPSESVPAGEMNYTEKKKVGGPYCRGMEGEEVEMGGGIDRILG